MQNATMKHRPLTTVILVAALTALSACSTGRVNAPAPVKARNVNMGDTPTPNGYHQVRPGDTLAAISRLYSVSWRDLAAWNNLTNPDVVEIGQVLRVTPPASSAASPAAQSNENSQVVVRPISNSPNSSSAEPAKVAEKVEPEPTPKPTAGAALSLIWPADGPIVSTFDGNVNKGVGIGGTLGSPVVAAADGRVVYAGSGLRGYGNLVIIKHDDQFLTAYAHNQALLVKEDQAIKQGQRIAEMGNSESDVVKLHFEVRQLGKPVNPTAFLPSR